MFCFKSRRDETNKKIFQINDDKKRIPFLEMNQPIFNFIYSFHMPEKNIYV